MIPLEQKIIYSEQLYVAVKHTEIITVLGSCVAVCLYDKKNKISGMNHYLLPLWNGDGLKSLKYGNISTERLIEAMFAVGADKRHLEAKIFGGAQINISRDFSVAPHNIQIALDTLRQHRIPCSVQDTGGSQGRKILFSNEDGSVYVKYSK
ncbi:MAG: chemotaxis protein CheD [Sulfurimonas sp.]|nr:chemotaxis protein CheD [Sulfurimonas sp.]